METGFTIQKAGRVSNADPIEYFRLITFRKTERKGTRRELFTLI